MDTYEMAIEYARTEGTRAGTAAASWVFDGNTPEEAYTAVLRGLDDGDPAVYDTLPYPDLSGEWADSLTGPQLVDDALSAAGVTVDDETGNPSRERMDWFTDICDAYETAFNDAVEDEVRRVALYQTGSAA